MLKRPFKTLYLKIQVSKYFYCLDSLDEMYRSGEKEAFLRTFSTLHAQLIRFPKVYNNTEHNKMLSGIYDEDRDLFSRMHHLINEANVEGLNHAIGSIRIFLDKLCKQIFSGGKSFSNNGKWLSTAVLLGMILIMAISYPGLKKKYSEEKQEYFINAHQEELTQQTLDDILQLREALQEYYKEHKTYPKSSGSWDGILSSFGQSKEDWIPGLAPKYIKALPRDPRMKNTSLEQYIYNSDGKDYKLIAHYPIGLTDVINKHPELIDVRRPTWAYGVWSEGGKNW